MTNFVSDATSIPGPKSDLNPLGAGDPAKYIVANDYNAVRSALTDIQGWLRGGTWGGLAAQATDPAPAGITNYLWLSSVDGLHLSVGGVDTQIGTTTPDQIDIVGAGSVASPLRLQGSSVGFVTARSYGVTSDGATDDSANLRLAIAGAVSLGVKLQLGAGTIIVDREASNSWCLDVPDNLTMVGTRGQTWIKRKAGAPNAQIVTIRANGTKNVTLRDLGFDGNWGNASTSVAGLSNAVGLPQAIINVYDTSEFPSSGTFGVIVGAGNTQTITYTGKTETTFTGCSGGTGTIREGARIGIADSQTGINHTTQTDPKNHDVMARGAVNFTAEGNIHKGTYGDCYWFGYRGDPVENVDIVTRNARIIGCVGDMIARNGISVGQSVDGLIVRDTSFTNVFQTALDTEPQSNNQYARNVLIDGCNFGLWWNPGNSGRNINQVLSISGGIVVGSDDAYAARNYRVINTRIAGNLGINGARGVTVEGCFFTTDFDHGASGGVSYAPIFLDHGCTHISILNNDIYDRGKFTDAYDVPGNPHNAAIVVQNYADSAPSNIRIEGNRIRARNGLHGIKISSSGGFAGAGGALQRATLETATVVSTSTVTVAGTPWAVDSKIGWNVYMGGLVGTVESNTSSVLTLSTRVPSGGGWTRPFGGNGSAEPAPSTGTFTLTVPSGTISVERNEIDCSNDGNGHGGYGIALYCDRSGMRVRVRGNNITNANDAAIYANATTATTNPFLEVVDNTAYDNQPTPTCEAVVQLSDGVAPWDKIILRNNMKMGGVRLSLIGASTGAWLENDGDVQHWIGYADPAGVVRAQIGSTFRRRDGGSGTCFYVKESNGSAIDVTANAGSTLIGVASGAALNYIPGDTTTVDACMIVMAMGAQPGSGVGDFDTYVNADLIDITRRSQYTIAGCLNVSTAVQLVAGAFAATTAVNNGAQAVYGPCAITITLRPEGPNVPPTYLGVGTRITANATATLTVAWPTNAQTFDGSDVQEGDYALMIAEHLENDTLVINSAQGFTECPDSPALGTYLGTAGTRVRAWECRAFRSAMTSPTLDYTAIGASKHVQVSIFVFRGCSLAAATGWVAK